MCLEEKSVNNLITKLMNERLSVRQRQWLWFVALWCSGLASVLILAEIIRLIMKI
jgi:hypothetical protein